jgi:hypothetical protein
MYLMLALIAFYVFSNAGQAFALSPNVAAARAEASIEKITGVDVPTRPIIRGTLKQMQTCDGTNTLSNGCAGMAYPNRIILSPEMYDCIRAYTRYNPFDDVGCFHVLIHEILHTQTHVGGDLEEGLVDALAYDIEYRVVKAITGHWPYMLWLSYPKQVTKVRVLSARKTRSPWQLDKAYEYRMWLWAAPDSVRFKEVYGV